MTYAFLPHLVTQDHAAVLNVTSALAFVPWPVTPTYNATKAACTRSPRACACNWPAPRSR